MPGRTIASLAQRTRRTNDPTLTHHHRIMAQAPAPKRPIKVLMLHGFTQSGPSFHAKTRALEKNLHKAFPAGISLTYLTAPHRLAPTDIPFALPSQATADTHAAPEEIEAFGWWRKKTLPQAAAAGTNADDELVYEGLEAGLATVAGTLASQGPFDGVIGFSQGAACAAMVAALLEPGRREAFAAQRARHSSSMEYPSSFAELEHAPLKFAVAYSGFVARGGERYKGFYEPRIATPSMHFLGTLDAVVDEGKSLALAAACEGTGDGSGRVVYHPGGHFLPSSQKAYVSALIGFMKEILAKAEHGEKEKEEESVEDMDMPF
ncbi:unnamed protein product [Periconia digitata]|uniref:Serine hydrolase domain-containing protein n=1 Tax=Periconia digitata TaxID=1303443 RepID=A0A9W4XW97_9PLEO|nr:unnamed protein product [Periconia digitata]